MVCLFLFCAARSTIAQEAADLHLSAAEQDAYLLALDLRTEAALARVADETGVGAVYASSLAEALELLVTEDVNKFSVYEERFLERLDKSSKGSASDHQFLQAEIRLHWAFVYLKFGHELDAARYLRQAYQIAEKCKARRPDFLPIRKTTGLLQVIVGSVPDKYNWILSLFNMSGSVTAGLADLEMLGQSESPFAFESRMLLSLAQGFVLARPAEALAGMNGLRLERPENRAALFVSASLALKNAQSNLALEMLDALSQATGGVPLYYADYLKGEAYLQKGEYSKAITSYRWFVDHQPGQNYIKDAYYKMGLACWLDGKADDAHTLFDKARDTGREVTEADKSAARSLLSQALPNVKLTKARYATDGGFYQQAENALAAITSEDLHSAKDETEYYYRKARLAHKLDRKEATQYYLETIRMTGKENWYFAPNACLQLGYIYQAQHKLEKAEEYFRRALSYRRHEYKNSIDSKARSALAQLGSM